MLRKFILNLLVFACLLCGCTSGGSENTSDTAESVVQEILQEVSFAEDMEPLKMRIIKGMLFDGEDIVNDACVYCSAEEGNSDFVGVFYTDQPKDCTEYLENWLRTTKRQMQINYPSQVFKISNAVIVSNRRTVILLICEDIEKAKECAERILD